MFLFQTTVPYRSVEIVLRAHKWGDLEDDWVERDPILTRLSLERAGYFLLLAIDGQLRHATAIDCNDVCCLLTLGMYI